MPFRGMKITWILCQSVTDRAVVSNHNTVSEGEAHAKPHTFGLSNELFRPGAIDDSIGCHTANVNGIQRSAKESPCHIVLGSLLRCFGKESVDDTSTSALHFL